MDDANHGEYARAPEFEDLIPLCKALNEHGVKYMLIGGFAVIIFGFTRGTKDIDFLVDPSVENIQKIKKALSYLPDNAVAEMNDDDIINYHVVRVADEFVIDLMGKACGVDYKEASKSIEHTIIDGIKIPIASKELLVRLKDTVRPSDKMDVSFLKSVIENQKKLNKLPT
ncbi:MAG: nucleotidyltransferase [Deltaproteobacteria bacterium]|nr:nucleotidyltransferase [Deltaproteobacteria bacterium]